MRPTIDQDDDKPHEECGVFGVWNGSDAAALTALGLHALQHRGQEAAGIVTLDEGGLFHAHKGLGLVGDNFGEAKVIASPARGCRGRPQPLCDHRRDGAAQRAAALRRFRIRRLRGGPQRQPDQCGRAEARAGAARLPVPVHHRFRGVHPPHRHQPVFHRAGPADRRAEAGAGRLFAGRAAQRRADRRAGPARRAAAGARPAGQWRLGAGARDLRARHRLRRIRARHRGRRDRRHQR